MTMTAAASFQAFLTGAKIINGFDRSSRVFGDLPVQLCWTSWMDPGVHTGFAMVLYATAGPSDARATDIAQHYDTTMKRIGVAGWPGGEPGAVQGGLPDLCSAALLAVHTELLTGDENGQVRTAVSRVGRLGAVFAGSPFWDASPPDDPSDGTPHIGAAGIGAESFINLRSERDRDYLSPVRVRSAFGYALEEEYGVAMDSQQPGDAKSAFSDIRTKRAGIYIPGPDHVRDAFAHALLAIRRNG